MNKDAKIQTDYQAMLKTIRLLAKVDSSEVFIGMLTQTPLKLSAIFNYSHLYVSSHEGMETFSLKCFHTNQPQHTNPLCEKKISELILKAAAKNTATNFDISQYYTSTPTESGYQESDHLTGVAIPFSAVQSNLRMVIVLSHSSSNILDPDSVQAWLDFLDLAGVLLDRLYKSKHLQDLATYDHLTGLLNRRAICEILDREHGRADRHERRYSVLFLDIDNFKIINDVYGHNVGDEALKEVAINASDILREGDWIGRWGGEEFICILPDTCEKGAESIATRLCHKITDSQLITHNKQISLTLSIGIASYPVDGLSVRALLTHADEGLLHAKNSGKNCAKRQPPRPFPPKRDTYKHT